MKIKKLSPVFKNRKDKDPNLSKKAMELGIENEKKIAQLISTLQLARSINCLIIAKCNELTLRELLYEKVRTALQDKISIYKVKIDASNKDLPGILSKTKVTPEIVFFVYGIEEGMPDVISYLNFKREVFYEIKRPVVIWVNDFVLNEIATKALDFWRFRSRVFEFRMPKMEVAIPKSIKELLRKRKEIDKEIGKYYTQQVTIMFTDIVGSTGYFAEKGDIAGFAAIERYNNIAFSVIKRYNGKIIWVTGDSIMVCFNKADDGILSAIGMQSALAKYNQEVKDKIHIRIGLHTGFSITRRKNTYGTILNIAAKIEALAQENQILISEAVKDGFEEKGFNLYFYGNYRLKGIPEEIPIYEVLWYESQRPKKPEKYKEPILFSLHNQFPPEPNFVGRKEMLETITQWYKDPTVHIGALIGWGGVGKSAIVRKWFDSLSENNIQPDGIFWWGFYRNPSLERFLEELLKYLAQGRIDLTEIKTTWQRVERIKEFILEGEYLIILDGLEQMQKQAAGNEFGKMVHREFTELLHYLADTPQLGLCLITTRFPLKDLENWHNQGYKNLELIDLNIPNGLSMLKKRGIKGDDEAIKDVLTRYKGHALSLEAEGLYKKAVELYISQRNWGYASAIYQNLADLQILTGNLLQAKESSEEAIRLSKEAGNVGYECISTAYLAYTLFLLSEMDNAGIEFEKAEEFQRKDDPSARYLYGPIGIWYADFLLAQGRIDEALDVTNENLRICERNNWIDFINLCHRSLAAIYRHLKDFKEAEANAGIALEGAGKTGRQDIEVESLIELARIKLEQSQLKEAKSTINHALQICQRCGYRLYEADAELLLARAMECSIRDTACIDMVDALQKAKSLAQSAYAKADEMHYHLPKTDGERCKQLLALMRV